MLNPRDNFPKNLLSSSKRCFFRDPETGFSRCWSLCSRQRPAAKRMNKSREKKLGDYDGSDRRNLHKVWWCFVRRDLHRRRKRSAWSFSRLSFRSSRVVSDGQTHSTRLCSLPARLLSDFNFGRRKNCAGARGTHDLVSARGRRRSRTGLVIREFVCHQRLCWHVA